MKVKYEVIKLTECTYKSKKQLNNGIKLNPVNFFVIDRGVTQSYELCWFKKAKPT